MESINRILLDIIYQRNKSLKTEILNAEGFSLPYHNKSIYDKFCSDNTFNVADFLRENKITDAIKIFGEIEKTFRPKGMNPNLDNYPPNDFFVENTINEKLYEYIQNAYSDDRRRSIVHIGNKGSGKTISQNIMLFRNNLNLEKSKTFWVRCDSHKLYNLWRKGSSIEKLIYAVTIQEYLDLQMVYVFCKYFQKSIMFKQIFNGLKDQNTKFRLQVSHDTDLENSKEIEAYKFAEKLSREINDNERNPQENYSYAVDKIMFDSLKSTKQRAKKRWLDFSICLQNFLHKNEYRVLYLVDGIDNVNLTIPASKPMYIEMKSQFADFVRKRPKNRNYVHVASMRSRTFNEMQQLITESSDTFHYSNPKNLTFFKQEKYDFTLLSKILQTRYDYVVENKIDTNLQYVTIIDKITKYVLSEDTKDKSTDSLFHENCRNYLLNRFGLIKLIFFRYIQLGQPSKFDIENAYGLFSHSNMFLNSRLFLDSRQGYFTDYGDYAFNIFNYPENRNFGKMTISNWNGLCCVRIIQLLKSGLFDRNTDEVIKNCLAAFNYSEELIDFHLERLRDFGYIDSYLFISQFTRKTEIEFKVNSKGNFIYDKIFSSFEILYTLALDSLLPSFLIEEEKYVDSFYRQANVQTEFPKNSIKTFFTFLTFLQLAEEDEKSSLANTPNCDINKTIYSKFFKIPIKENYLSYVESLEKYFHFLDKDQIEELSDLFSSQK